MGSGDEPARPQWPFVAGDGRSGGFVRSRRRRPSGGPGLPDEGVYLAALTASPSFARLPAPVPCCPPLLDHAGRRLVLAHGGGGGEHESGGLVLAHEGAVHEGGAKSELTLVSLSRPGGPPSSSAVLWSTAGSIEQVALDAGGEVAVLVVSPPGADAATLTSGRAGARLGEGPEVDRGGEVLRQVWSVELGSGRARHLSASGACVWEVAPLRPGAMAVIASAQAGEAAWYRSVVGELDLARGSFGVRYRPTWQVGALAGEPGGRIAFAEGWASDRGLVSGPVVVLASDGSVERRLDDLGVDVTDCHLDRHGRLVFAGWDGLGTAWGIAEPGGRVSVQRVAASLMGSAWRPSLAASDDGAVRLAVRSDERTPPEVVLLAENGAAAPWAAVPWAAAPSAAAPSAAAEADRAPLGEAIELGWEGPDGQPIQGLLLLPERPATGALAGALVCHIHGGPTVTWHHSWDPGRSNRLLRAGLAVLLANPRGSAGRGSRFVQANHGDPGGAELADVLAGIARVRSLGALAAGRTATMGGSYGGYLSSLAAVTEGAVDAAVVSAGMSDLTSCRNTCNNPVFYDLLLGGAPSDPVARRLYVERSAVYRVGPSAAPTLILHGEEDRCVPVGQAHELFFALRDAGAEVELVTYPREGHQLLEDAHLEDYWSRVLRWCSTHLAA